MRCPECGGETMPCAAHTLSGIEVAGYRFCRRCCAFVTPAPEPAADVIDVASRIVSETR